MELQIQKLLRAGMTKEELLETHGVHLKDPINGKVTLNYDQLKARDADPVSQECRGLILRDGSFDIVAFPFKRFFNHGQGAAAQIHWDSAQILEKLDGSLVICYWDKEQHQWCAATRGMAEAQGNLDWKISFRDLVEKTCIEMGYNSLQEFFSPAPKNHTLIFELTAPENRIVCEYPERKMTLLGARNLDTLQEIEIDDLACELNVSVPKTWQFNKLETLIEVISTWSPKDFEGVVLKDKDFSRVKIKSPKYLLLHHSIDSLSMSWKAVFTAVAQGHSDDLEGMLSSFIQERLDTAKEKINNLIQEIEKDWVEYSHIENQKEFALAIKDKKCPSALFALRNKKIQSVQEFIKNTNPELLLRTCGVKE